MEIRNTSGTLVATIVSEIDQETASFNRSEDVPESACAIELPPGSAWQDYRNGSAWHLLSRGKIVEELWEEVERFFGRIMP